MKQIWIFNHYATNMFMNKGGRHYWFAENLLKHEYSPTIFCANQFHNSGKEIELDEKNYKQDESNNVPFVFVKSSAYQGNGYSRLKNMMSFAVNLFSVTKKVAKKQGIPDVILASSVHPLTLIAGIFIARRYQIPCICEVRDLWPESIFVYGKLKKNSLFGKVLQAGEKWIYKKADQIIFTVPGGYDYIKEQGWTGEIPDSKCHYINNGVDLEAFDFNKEHFKIQDDDLENPQLFKVVYTGSIRLVNRIDLLLDAAKLIKNPNVKILIWGDGSELEELKGRLISEEIHNVILKGRVNKKYIPYILSMSNLNLYVLPDNPLYRFGVSLNKSFEYFASGKPTLSTSNSGYSIIDQYKCGICLERCEAILIAKAIETFCRLSLVEYENYCTNARRAAENFDFKILTEKLIHVIETSK